MIFKQEIIAIIVCAVLACTHVYAYLSGRDAGKRKFDEAIAEQNIKRAEAEYGNRVIEQQLNQDKQKIEVRYVESKRQAAAVATNNLIQLDELRHQLAARIKPPQIPPPPVELMEKQSANFSERVQKLLSEWREKLTR